LAAPTPVLHISSQKLMAQRKLQRRIIKIVDEVLRDHRKSTTPPPPQMPTDEHLDALARDIQNSSPLEGRGCKSGDSIDYSSADLSRLGIWEYSS
jgi:hypothetical protein